MLVNNNLLPLAGLLLAAPFTSAHESASVPHAHLHKARDICHSAASDLHCVLAKEATEGPYYIDAPLVRSNLTEDRSGVPFTLSINIVEVANCQPVQGVYVDIWHADAIGVYSGWGEAAEDNVDLSTHISQKRDGLVAKRWGPGPPERGDGPYEPSRYLRGVQKSDANGLVTFDTIWPGWYEGRTTHIHVRVHAGNVTVKDGTLLEPGRTAHTGQFFFADKTVLSVRESREPYRSRTGRAPMLNGDDGIYKYSDGAEQLVEISEEGAGFVGRVTVGVDSSASREDDEGFPGGPPGGHWAVGAAGLLCLFSGLGYGGFVLYKRWQARKAGAIALQ